MDGTGYIGPGVHWPGAERWATVRTSRVVLAVAHTMAGLTQLADSVELLAPDVRVQVIHTEAPDRFGGGVAEHLRRTGSLVIPWGEAIRSRFDLILGTDSAEMHRLHGPVVALSHGITNNKSAPDALGGTASGLVAGLGAPWLTHFGRLVPALVALPHHALLPVLDRQCPAAVPVARVVGDLTLDCLLASAALRSTYRRLLGIDDHHVLVAVSSTWGTESLFGRSRALLDDLVTCLPRDRYTVAVVLHPAIWWWHGPSVVLAWLREARIRGLRIVEPLGWRGLLAAADIVLGDHGSPTVYAAAAGRPVLRTARTEPAPPPGAARALLSALVPVLCPGPGVERQLRAALRSHDPRVSARIADAVTSARGRAGALLRTELYRLLCLSEPVQPSRTRSVDAPKFVGW